MRGITLLRNCGSPNIGALRVAGGAGCSILLHGCQFLGGGGVGVEITAGGDVTLTHCVVIGPGANDGVDITGVAGSVYVLYSVVVTNAFGSVTSSVARLTVIEPRVTGADRNPDGSVTLRFMGLPHSATRLWATTNLAPPVLWQPVFTNNDVGPDGTWLFTDPQAPSLPARFYRFSTP